MGAYQDFLNLLQDQQYSVDDVKKMIRAQESLSGKLDTSKPNYAGAYGPMQVTPIAFQQAKNKGLIPLNYEIANPKHSEEAGNKLIEDSYKRYGGDADKVMAEYYGGPSAIEGDKIHYEYKDKKNPKAPTIGQYIKLAKEKFENLPKETKGSYSSYLDLLSDENLPDQKTEEPYRPGYFNPNLMTQVQKARASGGSGALNIFGEDVEKALRSMSLADWEKNSALSNMLKYGYSTMMPGEQPDIEARNKLIQTGQNIGYALTHPLKTASDILSQRPGELVGGLIKGTIYEPETLTLGPVGSQTGKVLKPIASMAKNIAEPIVSTTGKTVGTLQEAINAARQVNKPIETIERPITGVGAANVTPETQIQSILPNLSEETQNFVRNQPTEKINIPALETKALEEKHGINLSKGQRTDKNLYADEWNRRATDSRIQELFSSQPQQFVDAFDRLFDKHASNIGEINKENIGQNIIQGLLDKDKVRTNAINAAYKRLEDANGGQFPIDVTQLNENITNALSKKLKLNTYEDKLGTIKKDIDSLVKNGNMSFADFENLRSNLADEMRSNSSGSARAAAHIIRDELENLPMSAEAQNLKGLADQARALYRERAETIKNNPAYKAAIKEASTAEEAETGQGFLKADKFHDNHVKNATPEAVRRLVDELKDNPQALEAIRAGDLLNAQEALVPNKTSPNLRPDMFNKYLRNQATKAKYIHSPESLQDLVDLEILAGKVAQPKTGVFNTSNSSSSLLGEFVKQGILAKGELALAGVTKGASIPAVSFGKQLVEKFNKDKFAQETVHPHSGLTNE